MYSRNTGAQAREEEACREAHRHVVVGTIVSSSLSQIAPLCNSVAVFLACNLHAQDGARIEGGHRNSEESMEAFAGKPRLDAPQHVCYQHPEVLAQG
jgi:hypothetical protein